MTKLPVFLVVILFSACVAEPKKPVAKQEIDISLDEKQATRLAALPLKCLNQEFPNKLGQVLGDSTELLRPKTLHPAFYGCFDWHSSVHGHWLLVTLLKEFPELDQKSARQMLTQSLTKENIQAELAFFATKHNASFERTYGWAWVLQLQSQLNTLEDTLGKQLSKNLRPLSNFLVKQYQTFLPKLSFPLRSGEHINTAFGLSMAYDYAVQTKNNAFKNLLKERAKFFFGKDKNANLGYEPSGFDFLSPIFEEIQLMHKVLSKEEFNTWLAGFLPEITDPNFMLKPAAVTDRTDGKLVHLDGLNLSRAWCLYSLSNENKKLSHLRPIADAHLQKALSTIFDGDYMGEHWLASFALKALLERGK